MSQLDLKYRPRNFSQVLGNHGVKRLLLTRSKNRTLDHQSMMLSGPKGCGKTTLARIIAKAISCANLQDGEPCNECGPCMAVMNDNSLSFEEMDAASHGTVDKIRDMVKDADYETLDGMKQVYIVDEAQRLSAAAQEAFLKAIESRLFTVILCTTDPQKVKTPIRSRLEEYPIYPPSSSELLERLTMVCEQEKINYHESGLKLIAIIKENCPRECLIALDTISQIGIIDETSVKSYFRYSSFELVSEVLSNIDNNPQRSLQLLDELSNKESPSWIKDHIVMAISSAMRVGVGAKPTFLVPTNFFEFRGREWAIVVNDLLRVDKINIYDIESILLKDSRSVPIVSNRIETVIEVTRTEQNQKPTQAENPVVKTEPKLEKIETSKPSTKVREVTVDGINFSSDELLTSLDNKINKKPSGSNDNQNPVLQVELSLDHVPITEKEFSECLISRIKG